MRRKSYNINLRFYVFMILFIGIVIGLCLWIFSPQTDYIRYGRMSQGGFRQGVVIYDEQIIEIPENDKLIYAVSEGDRVEQGQSIADIYKKGYVVSAVKDLWELQKNIVAAQENDTIKDIYKPELVQYDLDIEKTLKSMQDYTLESESYFKLNAQLKTLMEDRQKYIRGNFSVSDSIKLLYADEQERMAALNGWQESILAPQNGYISWFTDGLESSLKADKLSTVTTSSIKQIQKNQFVNNKREGEIAKIVSAEKFYIAVLWQSGELPSTGSHTEIYISGIEGAFNATVYDVINGHEKCIIYEVIGEVERVLGLRSVEISVNVPIAEGFIVPQSFIRNEQGTSYIYTKNKSGEKTKVDITVLAQENNYVLVMPKVVGELSLNGVIYNK